jgi:metal-responsive CopG/Arc/MetJ family transcriptional regulator
MSAGMVRSVKTIAVECPDRLHEQLDTLAREGWIKNPEQAVLEALRRFLDSHRPDLQRAQILSDVQWGLHGRE